MMDNLEYFDNKFSLFIYSDKKFPETFLYNLFPDKDIELEGKDCLINELNMSYKDLIEKLILLAMSDIENSFGAFLESKEDFFMENYIYTSGDDFIERKFVSNERKINSGMEMLVAHVFNEKSERIKFK